MAGAADGFEIAVRALIGQQVSVKAARSLTGNLVMAAGRPLERPNGSVTHTFPTPAALAELAEREPGAFPMPEARRVALGAVAGAVASGDLVIDPGVATADLEKRLLAIRGIGPWTASYIALRAIGDPDAFLPTDLGLRRAAAYLGQASDPVSLAAVAERWRPWRAYALAHLWSAEPRAPTAAASKPATKPGPPPHSLPKGATAA